MDLPGLSGAAISGGGVLLLQAPSLVWGFEPPLAAGLDDLYPSLECPSNAGLFLTLRM